MNLYVGNLPYTTTEDELREMFGVYGAVDRASLMKDKISGQSRGFAFVEMPSADEATAAINGLNGKDMKGRALTVNEARPKTEGGGSGGGRGGFGGGRGDRGGYGDRNSRDRY